MSRDDEIERINACPEHRFRAVIKKMFGQDWDVMACRDACLITRGFDFFIGATWYDALRDVYRSAKTVAR